ncbi:MAG: N-acetyl-gamma-glutamyl-phosphate reductase [Pseudomonadota bacterium]
MSHIKTAILGASGYTGAELVRLLSLHPNVQLKALAADRKAGMAMEDVFPHLSFASLPVLQKIEDIDFSDIDLVFCALPHGLTQNVIAGLPKHLRVIDLSADFRLRDGEDYAYWYGHPHYAPDLQKKFIYGLPEFYRSELKDAHYVANTGCYVASALLALLPLVKHKAISFDNIIIDAKSGVSGAGRVAKENILFSEVSEGFSAYGVREHRHSAEIEQELSLMAQFPIKTRFTPHLLPQNRCILSTIYVDLAKGQTAEDLHKFLLNHYKDEYFIKIMPYDEGRKMPHTHYVRGSNFVMLGVSPDRISGKAKIISVLDNLIKGASGQAIQNMNIMYGFNEETALQQLPLYP